MSLPQRSIRMTERGKEEEDSMMATTLRKLPSSSAASISRRSILRSVWSLMNTLKAGPTTWKYSLSTYKLIAWSEKRAF